MSVDSVSLPPVLDVEGTLVRFGGDEKLYFDISGMFLDDAPPLLEKLRNSVHDGDATAVRMHAHALKGLMAGCGGVRAATATQALENAGQHGQLSDALALLESITHEHEALIAALRKFRRDR